MLSRLYAPLNKHLIYPFYYRRHGDERLARLEEIEAHQWQSRAELEALQLERLQKLVAHAYNTTDWYRQQLDSAGIAPQDIRSLNDLTRLPLLSKADLQQNLDALCSRDYAKGDLIEDASGGSTGQPTIFCKDLERHRLRRADQYRHDRWTGWDIGQPWALVWGAQHDLSKVQSARETFIAHWVERSYALDAFEMNEATMRGFTKKLQRIRPRMILGYANALFAYAQHLLDKEPQHSIRPAGIVSSAEALTEEKRQVIEQAFSCKVLNRYGSREAGLMASECNQQEGLHINADNVILEVLRPDGSPCDPGESGDIVVTDLWNLGMPMIRYRMGDRGWLKAEPCSCGRGLPLLGAVEGRVSDFLVANDGTLVHGEYFTHLFYGMPGVRRFQLVQENRQQVTLRLELDVPLADIPVAKLETEIRKMLGADQQIDLQVVDTIPATRSGKFLFTISKLPQP